MAIKNCGDLSCLGRQIIKLSLHASSVDSCISSNFDNLALATLCQSRKILIKLNITNTAYAPAKRATQIES